MPALHLLFTRACHAVVTQVVEAEFGIGTVGDVVGVDLAAKVRVLAVLNAADRESQELVKVSHPFRVTFCQVVIDGHDMDASTGKGI